jgi:hypothetical protein
MYFPGFLVVHRLYTFSSNALDLSTEAADQVHVGCDALRNELSQEFSEDNFGHEGHREG